MTTWRIGGLFVLANAGCKSEEDEDGDEYGGDGGFPFHAADGGEAVGYGMVEGVFVDLEGCAERVIELSEGPIGLALGGADIECDGLRVLAGGFVAADLGVDRDVAIEGLGRCDPRLRAHRER